MLNLISALPFIFPFPSPHWIALVSYASSLSLVFPLHSLSNCYSHLVILLSYSNFVLIMPVGYSLLHIVSHLTLRGVNLWWPPPFLPHHPLSLSTDDGIHTACWSPIFPCSYVSIHIPGSPPFPLPGIIHFASFPPGKIFIQFSRHLVENLASARLC